MTSLRLGADIAHVSLIADRVVVVDLPVNDIYVLEGPAARLWSLCSAIPREQADLLDEVLRSYDEVPEEGRAQLSALVEDLTRAGVLLAGGGTPVSSTSPEHPNPAP